MEEIIRSGVRRTPDVAALASLNAAKRELAVLAWHYHDDDVPGREAVVELSVAGLPAEAKTPRLAHYRVDEQHSNAFAVWRKLGSPVAPTRSQYAQLEAASQLALLAEGATSRRQDADTVTLKFSLPRQAVSLVVLQW